MTENNKAIPFAHDHFFKKVMENPQFSKEFFEFHLPDDLKNAIDLNSLSLQSSHFIDEYYQQSMVDLLFKVSIDGEGGYVLTILEHQSSPDALMAYRMIKYTCQVIDRHLKISASNRLPLVIPLVIYHGEKPWEYSCDVVDLVNAPRALVDRYFLKSFQLLDLNKIPDEVLREKMWLRVVELTMKHIYAKNMMPYVEEVSQYFHFLIDKEGGISLLECVIIYILNRGQFENKQAFFKMISQVLPEEAGGKMATIREQLIQEGMQQGMQQGREEGIQEGIQKVALNLYYHGHSVASITELTGLPEENIKILIQNIQH